LISTLFIGYIYGKYVTMNKQTMHAEISVIPMGTISGTSMTKEIADSFDAIRRVKDLKAMLTPMGTQIETNNFANIPTAIEAAHLAVRSAGAKRIITTSLQKKIDSVMEKL
jgi:uncharacterized protein YqgV (UPF0045/DUF77 family)